MEDRNHGLAWTKPNNGIYTMQNSLLACVAADSFPFSGGVEIEQANEKRASEGARLGWAKKLGRSREGVSKKGEEVGRKGTVRRFTPSPYCLFCHSFAVFLPFASVWKRKGNGCYAGQQSTAFAREQLHLNKAKLWTLHTARAWEIWIDQSRSGRREKN